MAFRFVERLLLDHPRAGMRWIGLEVERFVVDSHNRVLAYDGRLERILDQLIDRGFREESRSGKYLLAVMKELTQVGFEPGSQLEVSLAPRQTIGEVEALQKKTDQLIGSLSSFKDCHFLNLGLNPFESWSDRKLLPSPRYSLMDQYFGNLPSSLGRDMMRLSCGLQVNLDFADEKEGIQMIRAGFLIAPALSALFANSPYRSGKATGIFSERTKLWRSVDPARSGFLKIVFDQGFSLKHYAEYASEVPLMYYYDENDEVLDPKGKALKDLSPELQKKNAFAALRQIFTEVRFKPCCVELRFFDGMSDELRLAAAAVSVGLLYDEKNRQKILEMMERTSVEDLEAQMGEAAVKGLQSDQLFAELCKLVEYARAGLNRRGFKEESYLKPLETLLEKRESPGSQILKSFGTDPRNLR